MRVCVCVCVCVWLAFSAVHFHSCPRFLSCGDVFPIETGTHQSARPAEGHVTLTCLTLLTASGEKTTFTPKNKSIRFSMKKRIFFAHLNIYN